LSSIEEEMDPMPKHHGQCCQATQQIQAMKPLHGWRIILGFLAIKFPAGDGAATTGYFKGLACNATHSITEPPAETGRGRARSECILKSMNHCAGTCRGKSWPLGTSRPEVT
jgi:hypothetical protein